VDRNQDFEKLKAQLTQTFEESFVAHAYGLHMFQQETILERRGVYLFDEDDKGDAVWLLQMDRELPQYQPIRVSEPDKLSRKRLPALCYVWEIVHISESELLPKPSVDRLLRKVSKGGESLADRVNKLVVDVLLDAVPQPIGSVGTGASLRDALAAACDQLSTRGFHPDTCLFPKGLEHRLVRSGIVKPDQVAIAGMAGYIGHTETGLVAFVIDDLPLGTLLVFDRRYGVIAHADSEFDVYRDPEWPLRLCMRGVVPLNPIVSNVASVARLDGIERAREFEAVTAVADGDTSGGARGFEPEAGERLEPNLDALRIRGTLKSLIELLLADADLVYHAGAHVAAVLLYRSVIEALLLGLLSRRRRKAQDPSGQHVPKDRMGQVKPVEEWKLEEMIRRAVEMGLMDDTDESSLRTAQRYGNLIHPALAVERGKGLFRVDPEDCEIVRNHVIKLLKRYGALPD